MADNNGVITRAPSKHTAIANVVLDVADNGTFRDRPDGKDVTDDEGGFLPAEDELAGVHSLGGNEELVLLLVTEGVAECDLGERCTATGVVDHVGDDTFEVTVPFTEVEAAEPCRSLAVVGVRFEHGACTFTLSADHTTHCGGGGGDKKSRVNLPPH